jgi:phage terminase large subunit GpA-like protein
MRSNLSLQREWTTEDGRKLCLGAPDIDIGGHFTERVYKFCATRCGCPIYAIKGMGRNPSAVAAPRRRQQEVQGHNVKTFNLPSCN